MTERLDWPRSNRQQTVTACSRAAPTAAPDQDDLKDARQRTLIVKQLMEHNKRIKFHEAAAVVHPQRLTARLVQGFFEETVKAAAQSGNKVC
jgi:hypothetical protein